MRKPLLENNSLKFPVRWKMLAYTFAGTAVQYSVPCSSVRRRLTSLSIGKSIWVNFHYTPTTYKALAQLHHVYKYTESSECISTGVQQGFCPRPTSCV